MSDNSRRDDETETEVDRVEVRRSTTEYAEEDVDVERTDYDREEIEATSDVEEIRQWADEHDAVAVRRSGAGDHGLALVRERDVSSDMEELSWDEFGREMEDNHLAFLYIEGETAGDHAFYDLIDRGHDVFTEGEAEYTEVRRTKMIETEVVERDVVESEVVESEVAETEVVDVELLSRECHGCELEGDDTLMADIEEEKRVRMAVYERDVIATQVVDTDVEETSTVTSDTVETETEEETIEHDEESDLVDEETVEREVEETDVVEREEVEADVVDADVEEDVQMERKLIEATIREHYRVRADVFERELLDSETLDQEVVESELVEEADVEYDETDIETGVDEQVVGDEVVAADVGAERSTDAETGPVSIDDIDEGQTVYDARDEKIGPVTDVEDDLIHVDPHAGLGDRIKASLGWGDQDGDDYTIRVDQIETVDRDGVHLRTMESDVTEEDEDERGL
ncbi:hypothetical protein [Halalkalicoccus salilacus]|uniref:hypothetical protein n=1 Tax=Halalkalicoccus salilacus TaxID=3117459 RepID=UPI00300F4BFC